MADWLTAARAIDADLIAVTGDLTETPGDRPALIRLRHQLQSLEIPTVTVPGNHDVSHPGTEGVFYDIFGPFPRVFEPETTGLSVGLLDTMAGLPRQRRTPAERLNAQRIGWYSRGSVGAWQRDALEAAWGRTSDNPDFPRILCLHHHLVSGEEILGRSFDSSAPDRFMIPCLDADAVIDWAADHDVRLILHGHQHRWWPTYDVGPADASPIAVSNPGSSTHGKPVRRGRAIDITRDGALTVWDLSHIAPA